MTWAEILALVQRKPREEALLVLDKLESSRPDLLQAIDFLRSQIVSAFDQPGVQNIPQKTLTEAVDLFQKGFGPVSDAPEIGLV